MATPSTMVPLGSPLPPFELPDVTGLPVASSVFEGRPRLVAFLCNHCPYVVHIETALGALTRRHPDLSVVGICTNDADGYPQDAPAKLAEQAARAGWNFRYLVDTTQDVGRAFGAACTPDFFLYDAAGLLAYRGAMDASSPGNDIAPSGDLLDAAITDVLAGRPAPEPHRPSMGCSIKWRDG